jgi:N-acetylneuraminate synthase/N,N'-diacetyllegionaminate synthase
VKTLRDAFPGLLVGFSDHTESNQSAVVARALGATVFEKHFTLDKGMEGPDHWFSPNPQELKIWVDEIRAVDAVLGDFQIRMRPAEASNKREFQRVIVAKRDIKIGEMLNQENVTMGRVAGGLGLAPKWIDLVNGKVATSNYRQGEAIEL